MCLHDNGILTWTYQHVKKKTWLLPTLPVLSLDQKVVSVQLCSSYVPDLCLTKGCLQYRIREDYLTVPGAGQWKTRGLGRKPSPFELVGDSWGQTYIAYRIRNISIYIYIYNYLILFIHIQGHLDISANPRRNAWRLWKHMTTHETDDKHKTMLKPKHGMGEAETIWVEDWKSSKLDWEYLRIWNESKILWLVTFPNIPRSLNPFGASLILLVSINIHSIFVGSSPSHHPGLHNECSASWKPSCEQVEGLASVLAASNHRRHSYHFHTHSGTCPCCF